MDTKQTKRFPLDMIDAFYTLNRRLKRRLNRYAVFRTLQDISAIIIDT